MKKGPETLAFENFEQNFLYTSSRNFLPLAYGDIVSMVQIRWFLLGVTRHLDGVYLAPKSIIYLALDFCYMETCNIDK